PPVGASTSTAASQSPAFIHHPPPTDLHPLSLHDALPICIGSSARPTAASRPTLRSGSAPRPSWACRPCPGDAPVRPSPGQGRHRSEEHTSELQSRENLVCRLLLDKKKHRSQRDAVREQLQ